MHTLPGVRVGALSATAGSNTTGTLHAVPSWSTPSHSSSSHATAHRRLLQHSGPAQTALHASLPKVGVIAVPEESLAAARLSQQSQQQQSAQAPRRLQVRRARLVPTSQQQEDFQQPTALQQQLTDLQVATQQQQQQLWQAQAAAQAPQYQASQYQGSRQQAWSAQYQTNSRSSQQSPARRSQQPADRQQRQQYQPRHQQQQQQQQQQDGCLYQSYQSDQSTDNWYGPQQGQQQQHRTHQQRQGQGYQSRPQQQQQQQWATKPQHQQQPQQQSGPRWQPGSGQPDWYQQRPQQPSWQPQQPRQQQRQQQYIQRPDERLTPSSSRSDLSDSAATDGDSSSSSSQLKFSHGLKQDWSLPTGMAVTYLGSSSGAPTRDRNVSCTVLRLPESMYLVDCGEGSSRQAKLTGLALEQVETLFITHLHGDHCFGIGTMLVALCKARQAAAAAAANGGSSSSIVDEVPGPDSASALRVVGPPRLGELVASMLYIAGVGRQLDQPVYVTEFVETASEAHDWEPLPVPAAVSVSSAASSCPAFICRMAPTKELPLHEWPPGLARRLDRTGLQWQENRRAFTSFYAKAGLLWQIPCRQAIVTAAQLQHRIPCWGYVFEERVQPAASTSSNSSDSGSSSVRGRRVVLLGDTVDSRPIAPIALGADLVSHEATFAAGMENKAAVAQHSTAWMAGQFAWAIQAKALVLTHFSARYEGNKDKNKWLSPGAFEGRRGRADASTDADSEERTIKALQREADDQYGLGPVLLAIDLLTAHVPKQDGGQA